jgi:hypothetical protein
MPRKTKINPELPNAFQITEVEKNDFILIGNFTRKQLETLVQGLQGSVAGPATGWRRKFRKLAKAIVASYDRMKGK